MPDNKKAPGCPYCGSKMRHKQSLVCRTEDVDFMVMLHWYECTNEECESESPARNTAERAYEAAVQAVSKWQLVSETLPSHEMYVLGFDKKKSVIIPTCVFIQIRKNFTTKCTPESL